MSLPERRISHLGESTPESTLAPGAFRLGNCTLARAKRLSPLGEKLPPGRK